MASDELPVGASVVRAATRATYDLDMETATWFQDFDEVAEFYEAEAEAAIRAADEARGMRTEEADGKISVEGQLHLPARLYRLVSDWMPVDNKERP